MEKTHEKPKSDEKSVIVLDKPAAKEAPAKPGDVAQAVLGELRAKEKKYLKSMSDLVPKRVTYNVYDIPAKGEPERFSDIFHKDQVHFGSGRAGKTIQVRNQAQVDTILSAWRHGVRGLVKMPLDETACRKFLEAWEAFVVERDGRIRELIAKRTPDEENREKIFELTVQALKESN